MFAHLVENDVCITKLGLDTKKFMRSRTFAAADKSLKPYRAKGRYAEVYTRVTTPLGPGQSVRHHYQDYTEDLDKYQKMMRENAGQKLLRHYADLCSTFWGSDRDNDREDRQLLQILVCFNFRPGSSETLNIKHPRWRSDSRTCLLYTSPSPRDLSTSRMPSSA